MSRSFDAIVVGAGPAGSAAAKIIARGGAEVALLERGLFPGAKNVSGAALYDTALLEKLYPGFYREAPVERYLTRKNLGFITEQQLLSIAYHDDNKSNLPYKGYSIQRGRLDRWLAQQAVNAGAHLFTQTLATEVIKQNNQITGIVLENGERLNAPLVIAADGANSLLARSAGLKKAPHAETTSLGVKEIIALPQKILEERFQLKGNEGASYEFVGMVSGLANGGGFLYTNRDSISIGIVAQLSTLQQHGLRPYDLLESFKEHPAIAPLLREGKTREYGAHLIPEGGFKELSRLTAPGIMVAGDAAGFVMVTGYLLLGINYALESGMLAGETALEALQNREYSHSLQNYKNKLTQCGLLKTFSSMRGLPKNLVNNVNLQNRYPQLICDIMHNLYNVETKPLPKMLPLLWRSLQHSDIKLGSLLLDLIKIGGSLGI
ncbi:MAG: FAD-dependent monooxygenase [Firmicutes bacterium]|nr:FAD-dependent monooxygenase [Bacillota bacterium]